MYCTKTPKKKAMATDTKMATITCRALSVLMRSPICKAPALFIVFTIAKANVPPNNANIIDTVVDVGSPIVLNMSSKTTSMSMTANKILMISFM